jgi:hypothetical protein
MLPVKAELRGGGGGGGYNGGTAGDTSGLGRRGQAYVAWTDGHLTPTAQPASTLAGATISTVTIEVRDFNNSADVDATGTVTVSFSGSGVLSGTLTRSPVNGVYTFDDLSISAANTGIVLTFTHNSTGYTVNSDSFDITVETLMAQACL